MFGSAILEVAIGMILIYLVLSLIMTSVQEGLHAFMKARARNLEQALLDLFQGDETVRRDFYNHPLIFALHTGTRDDAAAVTDRPSYIPRETFSAALMDVMEREEAIAAQVPEPLREAYDGMKRAAEARAGALRGEIERWYDAAMDRASGRFKRKSQASLFVLSLVLAVLLNFNSIVLAQYLAVSPQQRELVVGFAEQTWQDQRGEDAAAASPPGAPSARSFTAEDVNALTGSLNEVGLPIGWKPATLNWIRSGFPDDQIRSPLASPGAFFAWLLLAAGYLMTAFAVMLGAPFWFDVLNKFMVIRGTVKPTEKSRDEASEDRQRRPIVVSPEEAPSRT